MSAKKKVKAHQPTRLEYANALMIAVREQSTFYKVVDAELPSVANLREHPMAKAKRAKAQRMVGRVLAGVLNSSHKGRWIFILTRIAPRQLDSDNLASCFKSLRDGIADRMGINDGDSRIIWHYEQVPGPAVVKFEGWRLPEDSA